jgi:hypothetical protein
MIDISDKKNVFGILNFLKAEERPRFGLMTAQHMVEHLGFALRFSNGKESQTVHYPKERLEKIKVFLLDSEKDWPANLKNPLLPREQLPSLKQSSLNSAIAGLEAELNDFDAYFVLQPQARPVHPTMGELTFAEWILFHNRHFTHHFKQFGLLGDG